jgi:hypothetical protein
MALWIMMDFLPLINADKFYFYRICNITHETVNHAAAAAVYSPPVAAVAVDIHDCLYVCIGRATFL